jgi:hypothetical protein
LQDPVADEAGLSRWFEETGIDKDEGKVVVSLSDATAAQDTSACSLQPVSAFAIISEVMSKERDVFWHVSSLRTKLRHIDGDSFVDLPITVPLEQQNLREVDLFNFLSTEHPPPKDTNASVVPYAFYGLPWPS